MCVQYTQCSVSWDAKILQSIRTLLCCAVQCTEKEDKIEKGPLFQSEQGFCSIPFFGSCMANSLSSMHENANSTSIREARSQKYT